MNIRNMIMVAFALFFHVNSFSKAYFYCVAKNGEAFNITPHLGVIDRNDKFEYGIYYTGLIPGETIQFEENTTAYTVTQTDITAGNFKSLKGYATPYVYFIYAKNPNKSRELAARVGQLENQCRREIDAQYAANLVFEEVRVSESMFSGLTNLGQTGYPLVYIKDPVVPGAGNIIRVKVK